jgi:hypothetical protein
VELPDGNGAGVRSQEPPRPAAPPDSGEPAETAEPTGPAPRTADGIREIRRLFQSAQNPPRWPMYIRQAKQFLRNVDSSFDERRFGFANLTDLLRACQRDGLFRIERDRQGVIRLFPGNVMQPVAADDEDNRGNVIEDAAPVMEPPPAAEWAPPAEAAAQDVVDGDVVQEMAQPAVVDVEEAQPSEEDATKARRGRGRGRTKASGEGRHRKTSESAPRARKTSGRSRAPRKPRKDAAES